MNTVRHQCRHVPVFRKLGVERAQVNQLLEPGTAAWNVEAIRHYAFFSPK